MAQLNKEQEDEYAAWLLPLIVKYGLDNWLVWSDHLFPMDIINKRNKICRDGKEHLEQMGLTQEAVEWLNGYNERRNK